MKGSLLLKAPGILETWGPEISDFSGDICTDTRKIQQGQAYMALNGEIFRGIKFAEKALEQGSPLVITECLEGERSTLLELHDKYPQASFLIVDNATKYFQDVAKIWARQWRDQNPQRFLIGLTGSNGKTTTKEMLKFLLEGITPQRVLATKGNLNNQFGVPMTLLRLDENIDIGVIEMGTNSPGEIEILSQIAEAEAGLITNIGAAHLEFLGNLEGVFHEKIALYRTYSGLKNKKFFAINAKDFYLRRLMAFPDVTALEEAEGLPLQNHQYLYFSEDQILTILLQGKTYRIKNPYLQGEHNWENLALCLLLLSELFPEKTECLVERAEQLSLPEMNRGEWRKLGNGSRIYMDAYNANPDSMKASFNAFVSEMIKQSPQGKLLLIMGDMNELGENSAELHRQTAEQVAEILKEKNFEDVEAVFIGPHAKDYKRGWPKKAVCFSSTEEAKKSFSFASEQSAGIFLKGSRSLQLESIVDIVEKQSSN